MSKKLAKTWFEAFGNKDIDQLEGLLADDFLHSSPFGDVESKQAYLDLVRSNEIAFFSPIIEIQDIIENGDQAAVRYLVNGNPACDCVYSKDDKIIKIFSYYHFGKKPSF